MEHDLIVLVGGIEGVCACWVTCMVRNKKYMKLDVKYNVQKILFQILIHLLKSIKPHTWVSLTEFNKWKVCNVQSIFLLSKCNHKPAPFETEPYFSLRKFLWLWNLYILLFLLMLTVCNATSENILYDHLWLPQNYLHSNNRYLCASLVKQTRLLIYLFVNNFHVKTTEVNLLLLSSWALNLSNPFSLTLSPMQLRNSSKAAPPCSANT